MQHDTAPRCMTVTTPRCMTVATPRCMTVTTPRCMTVISCEIVQRLTFVSFRALFIALFLFFFLLPSSLTEIKMDIKNKCCTVSVERVQT
jgi:hypothetical protein